MSGGIATNRGAGVVGPGHDVIARGSIVALRNALKNLQGRASDTRGTYIAKDCGNSRGSTASRIRDVQASAQTADQHSHRDSAAERGRLASDALARLRQVRLSTSFLPLGPWIVTAVTEEEHR